MNKIKLKLKKLLSRTRSEHLIFLHVGKTAGTSLRHFILESNIPYKYNVRFPKHGEIPIHTLTKAHYFLSLRDPFERIVSGFNSRLRQGKPAYNNPWSRDEVDFYSRFPSFNAFMNECLNTPDLFRQFQDINIHAKYNYSYYLNYLQKLGISDKIVCLDYKDNQIQLCNFLEFHSNNPPLHLHQSPNIVNEIDREQHTKFISSFLRPEYNSVKILRNE